jgi:maleylacetoacetate isomerase
VLAKVPEADRPEWGKHFISKGMNAFEQMLEQSRGKYCVGDQVTIADCYIVPQISALPRFNIDINQYKHIKEIFDNLSALPEFKAAHAAA